MTRRLTMLAVLLGSAALASAEDGYRHGRVLSVEPGVTLQRATEPGAEEAYPNLPFLPGDRVWTDRAGRAEFQFADGTVLRLDSASKLDYVAHDDGAGDRVVLRLWSGGLYLHNRDGRGYPDFGIETPAGVVEARVRGVYRIDADSGETRLSVYEGEAVLEAEREVAVRAGERVYARQGEPTDDPRGFDRAALDDFDRWDADREDRHSYAASSRRSYLPEAVRPYAGELDAYGSWYYESEIGHVWRPYVGAGWRPYYDGRWVWTAFGWTWVPNERWGWVPFHYGRWGYTPMIGWYWIPGHHWGPGWVTWAVGGDYVGWCPLGHRDRPVVFGGRRAERGRAVPRSAAPVGGTAWAYVRRADFTATDLMRRIEHTVPPSHEVHALPVGHARLSRDLHAGEGGTGTVAVPRNASRRFVPGDTAPELRTDPATTIPFPTARRRHREPQDVMRAVTPAEAAPEPAHPTDNRVRATRPADGDREVMRRVFRPLSHPRPAKTVERPTAHPRPPAGSARPAPPRAEPHPAPAPRAERPPAPAPRAEPRPAPAAHREVHQAPAPRAERQRPAASGEAQATRRPQKNKDH